jgi:hypothetical protein
MQRKRGGGEGGREGGEGPALDPRSPRINQIRKRFVFVTPTWAPRRDACVTGVTKPSRTGTGRRKTWTVLTRAPCATVILHKNNARWKSCAYEHLFYETRNL